MKILTIKNESFQLVKQRAYSPTRVYKGQGKFLRLGPKNLVAKELAQHKQLLKFGFPVAKILGTGKFGREQYYIEESLGDIHFGYLFAADIKKSGKISDSTFAKFLQVCLKLAESQIKHPVKKDVKNFQLGINVQDMADELPKLASQTKQAFRQAEIATTKLPYVLSHGDFGPFNIYPKGVIDLERHLKAPIGYDLITAICLGDFFPKAKGYEYQQVYHFTPRQIRQYLAVMDKLFVKNHLPKLSKFYDDFQICRCMFTAARMQRWPKIRAWRFQQYKILLTKYISGRKLIE